MGINWRQWASIGINGGYQIGYLEGQLGRERGGE
jgi:hypothetical protein